MKKIFLIGAMALSLSLGSCDSYLDINDSPNSPSGGNLNADLIFPGAEMALANSYGDYLRITGGYFAQHYAQLFGTSNYLDYSQFNQSAVRSSSTYTNIAARCLQNLSTVSAMSKAEGATGTQLAVTVLRAVAYQTFIDCYGEIPYSEALDLNNLTPKYDDGKDVYAALIAELDAAMAEVTGQETVCTNFLLPGERSSEWIKVANAIKLRLLMRESNAVDVKAQLAQLVSDNNFPDSDISWTGCWKNESGQANPFYQEEFATYFGSTQENVALNLALLAPMKESDDARLQAFFRPNSAGTYTGGVSGTNYSGSTGLNVSYWCRPTIEYNSPVYLITRAEIEFFLAEYEARYGSMSAAEQHYNAAITASFESAGIGGADKVIAAYPWNGQEWAKCIGIQKWIALSGTNNFEAWCEMRRLHYPAFGTVKGSDIYSDLTKEYNPNLLVAGTLYVPIQSNASLNSIKLLQRWPYPESSANRNAKAPEYKGDNTPVFWAE